LVRAKKAVGPRTPQENKILVSVLGSWGIWNTGILEYWKAGAKWSTRD
jgi:hypothetical protein